MREQAALTREGAFGSAIAGVTRDLGVTLTRLEALAARPSELVDAVRAEQLSALQYRLHAAAEAVLSLAAPAEAVPGVADLADALVAAREATGAVAGAVERSEPLGSLVFEWRGALFRVRMARERIARGPVRNEAVVPWGRLQGLLLLLCAVAAVVVGARAEVWPLVAGGGAGIALGVRLLLRP